MIHNEEAVNALERVAAEERGVAAERGALAADLTATRDRMAVEANAIGGMVEWWKARYPGTPAALELDKAHEWAVAQHNDVTARIAEVAKEQQAHEVAAAALTEDAARARAEWEAEHGKKVATGDRVTKAQPTVEPRPANKGGLLPQVSGACIVGQHEQCQEHGDGYPVPGSCACQCPEPSPADRMVEALTNPPAGPQATVTRVDGEAGQ
jgi:hypothetical protein